jgi:glucose-6-phosphate isomerase
LININAYHQPGVEAGKKAASAIIGLKQKIAGVLNESGRTGMTARQIAEKTGSGNDAENTFKICEYLAANPASGIVKVSGPDAFGAVYRKV